MIRKKRETLFKELTRRSSPVRIQIEATRRCNLNCVHCVFNCNTNIENELQPQDYRKLLPEMKAAGVFHINLTGGEFLTHPRYREILELLLESDFQLTLQTNGVLLSDGIIALLSQHREKIKAVAVSLYGHNRAIHESVTRTAGSFSKTATALEKLAAAGLHPEASTLLMTVNCDAREEIKSLCDRIGVRHQFYSIVLPRENRDNSPLQYRLPDSIFRELPRPWETFAADFGEVDPEDYLPDCTIESWCTMGRTTGYITSHGNLLPCSLVDIPAGNIREASFYDLWYHSDAMEEIRNLKVKQFECAHCGHFPKCRPCPGLGLYEHGDIFAAPREVCRIVNTFMGKENSDGKKSELLTGGRQ